MSKDPYAESAKLKLRDVPVKYPRGIERDENTRSSAPDLARTTRSVRRQDQRQVGPVQPR